jgi:hypothetical protein
MGLFLESVGPLEPKQAGGGPPCHPTGSGPDYSNTIMYLDMLDCVTDPLLDKPLSLKVQLPICLVFPVFSLEQLICRQLSLTQNQWVRDGLCQFCVNWLGSTPLGDGSYRTKQREQPNRSRSHHG